METVPYSPLGIFVTGINTPFDSNQEPEFKKGEQPEWVDDYGTDKLVPDNPDHGGIYDPDPKTSYSVADFIVGTKHSKQYPILGNSDITMDANQFVVKSSGGS
jgi:hypothetical protein